MQNPQPKRRDVLAAAMALAAGPVLAQETAPSPGVRVALTTPEGLIVVELATAQAPITTRNFLRYVDQKRYDGISFYRASAAPGVTGNGLVQGGLNSDPARKLPPIAHESTAQTGLSHTDGAISLARRAQGTATSEFFICVGDQTYLDADPKAPGDNAGFAAFGRVVEGMEVVRKILTMPVVGGEGMAGEMLVRPVPIRTARRLSTAP